MKLASIYCTVAALGLASAHTIMQRVTVGSTTYQQGERIYMPSYNGVCGRQYQEAQRSPLTSTTSSSTM